MASKLWNFPRTNHQVSLFINYTLNTINTSLKISKPFTFIFKIAKDMPPPSRTTTDNQSSNESESGERTLKDVVVEEIQQALDKSWFHESEEYRKRTARKSLTRLLFVSLVNNAFGTSDENQISPLCSKSIASNVDEFVSVFEKKTETKVYGGITLVSDNTSSTPRPPTAAIGFLEIERSVDADEFLMQLKNGQEDLQFSSIRILLCSDDCPCHDFSAFCAYQATPPPGDVHDITAEEATQVFRDIIQNLCRHSRTFDSEVDDDDTSSGVYPVRFKTLIGQHRKCIPSKLCIEACAKSSEFPSLDEYISIFMSPMNCKLESERSIPMPQIVDWDKMNAIAEECKIFS